TVIINEAELNGNEAWSFLPNSLTPGDETLYFANSRRYYNDQLENQLWKTDGTPEGTVQVPGVEPAVSPEMHDFWPIARMGTLGDTVFFPVTTAAEGTELWKSDGTTAGTILLADLLPGEQSSFPHDFFRFRDLLFFVASDAENRP